MGENTKIEWATHTFNPCERELRAAFQRSGLWRRGWSYHRAITTGLVRLGLSLDAIAHRAQQKKIGRPVPEQQALI